MQPLGYSATNPLKIKVTTRNLPPYSDPAVLLIDQLKHVYIEGELIPFGRLNHIAAFGGDIPEQHVGGKIIWILAKNGEALVFGVLILLSHAKQVCVRQPWINSGIAHVHSF